MQLRYHSTVYYRLIAINLDIIRAMIYDVAIVGAGIEGSAAGYYLTNSGMKNVLLLEQVRIVFLSS